MRFFDIAQIFVYPSIMKNTWVEEKSAEKELSPTAKGILYNQ